MCIFTEPSGRRIVPKYHQCTVFGRVLGRVIKSYPARTVL